MASFKSILSDIGRGLAKVFKVGVEVAQAAEPIVDVALPGIATLYNATVNEVVMAEAAAIAAGAQNGTGPQKLAAVVAAITPQFNQYAAAAGLPIATVTTIENWVNAVVQGLNSIPSVVGTPVPTAVLGSGAASTSVVPNGASVVG